MDSKDWHDRFTIQAKWTRSLREFLFNQLSINPDSRILEIGCGTGVILDDLRSYSHQPVFGIDHNLSHLSEACIHFPEILTACSQAEDLPWQAKSFDIIVSHYFFLWIKEPLNVLKETLRVLKPHGRLVILAEPDYLARVDFPQEFWGLAELQTRSLINQGVNPMIGRQLPQLLTQAGFENVQYGVSGFQADTSSIPEWYESEWKILQNDLEGTLSEEQILEYRKLDLDTRQQGSRVLWVPTFYAFGNKNY